MTLNIIIVGAGIAGLTAAVSLHQAGHHVRVYESSAFAAEVGAALNLAPNGTRVLQKLGFDMQKASAVPINNWDTVDGTSLRRIACQDLKQASERFGAAYVAVHRVDLHNELMRLAGVDQPGARGVELHLSSRVIQIDPEAGLVEFVDGRIEKADLIIGADGLHSVSRNAITSASEGPSTAAKRSTGLSAFRFLVPTEVLENHPAGKELLAWKTPGATLLGDPNSKTMEEERHMMWYPCRSGKVQNFVGIHPTVTGEQPENSEGAISMSPITPFRILTVRKGIKRQMLSEFSHFHPQVVEILSLGNDVNCWPLFHTEPLNSWTRGKLVVIGDAAHPMLPFGGQGSNQAIEDGGALGFLLKDVDDVAEIPARLELFEKVRRRRASRVQILSTVRANREHQVETQIRQYMEEDVLLPNSFAARVAHDAGFDVFRRCHEVLAI
ncbi:putative salicylate hydroxylase [Talaromyces proteolyticus]|uniref:Salicylate hydroxylase n=1 Tax=Talaromyces proteolyticus TaxID=1131652 RepID=A0AAD4Q1B0_9EURO|nr:putative salicylate hydroxylase [Talaromyces proteolyticus]KAH8698368.1 putative salicylate hydroxylase [Talaromyces proteolyticus]